MKMRSLLPKPPSLRDVLPKLPQLPSTNVLARVQGAYGSGQGRWGAFGARVKTKKNGAL